MIDREAVKERLRERIQKIETRRLPLALIEEIPDEVVPDKGWLFPGAMFVFGLMAGVPLGLLL